MKLANETEHRTTIRKQIRDYLGKSKKKINHHLLHHLVTKEILQDLGFFNFQNAITACFYTDRNFITRKVNENFQAFFRQQDRPLVGQDLTMLFAELGIEA